MSRRRLRKSIELTFNQLVWLKIILDQSAAEYLQRLKEKQQGKRDIRETSKMGMKDKYDYINQL